MKIKITEIEATAEELKASNTVADGLLNTLRSAFNPYYRNYTSNDECDDEEESE